MNFLELHNKDVDVYEEIKKHNGEAALSDLYLKKERAKEVIKYLESIGINNIYELLIYEIDIFKIDKDKIKEKIERYELSKIVQDINDDYFNIEKYI